MYDRLFERVCIGNVELKNRIVMGPMDESLGDNSGNVSPRCMEHFCARAAGGTGAIVTSYVAACPPELGGIAMPGQLRLLSIGNQLSFVHFAERIHAYGAKLFVQLHHPGRKTCAEYNDGSLENRCRIVVEIIEKIREVAGPRFPITVRLNAFEGEGLPGEAGAEEMRSVGAYLAARGVNGFHLTLMSIDRVGTPDMKAGWRTQIYADFKAAMPEGVLVYGPNEIKTPDEAQAVLESGCQDLITLARQQIADPAWANKARSGHADDIRPCISCNACMQQITVDHQPLRCSVNPLAGRELDNLALPAGEGTVVVIGGGPGGMQAALTAAARGFDVVLYEAAERLGGALQLANKAPNKFRIDNLIRYFERQIQKSPRVRVCLNAPVTAGTLDDIAALDPVAVIDATGGKQVVPRIPGVERAVMANDVLSGAVDLAGKKVAVVGGGMTGIETAELLASHGVHVTVLEMLSAPGRGIFAFNVTKTVDALERAGVSIRCGARVDALEEGAVAIADVASGTAERIPCDAAVLAIGVYTDHSMRDLLEARFDRVIEVGDANHAGKIMTAVRDGWDRVKAI